MPEVEPLTYTVTPGPAVLRKMGLSWTLFGPTGAHLATFSHGPGGEPPGPVDLALSKEVAAELAEAGYVVWALSAWPDAAPSFEVKASHMEGDVRVLDEVELREVSMHAGSDAGPGIDPIGGGTGPEKAIQVMPGDVAGEPGAGSSTEPVKRRRP